MLIQSKKPFTPSPSINCCCQAFIHTSVAPIGWAMLKYHKLVFCYTSHRHHFIFYKPPTICRMLREEGLRASRIRKHKFRQKHKQTNSIERRSGSGWPTKMTRLLKALVEWQMRDDNETTAVQLQALLLPDHPWWFIQCQIVLIVLFSENHFEVFLFRDKLF